MRFFRVILLFLIPASGYCQETDAPMLNVSLASDTAIFELAEFPGGNQRMAHFVKHILHQPTEAKKITGEVWISAVAEKDGNLTNLKVIQSLHPACDKAALRAVKTMPPWKPAKHDGKIVRCRVKIPIKFGRD